MTTSAGNAGKMVDFKMKKQLGLFDGVGIIIGVIVGAGIFVSPKGVLKYSGSIGMSIIVWISSGVLSMIGALCYAELGTMIPKSGGDYAYISEAFGPLPAFLYLWVALFILVPTANAITAMTFAQYILQPFFGGACYVPVVAVTLVAAAALCGLTAINCYNVKWVTRVTDTLTAAKIFALFIIIVAGFYYLFTGHREHLEMPMEDTNWSPGFIALAFYNGLFSYSGWNYLNFVTEELKNPYKNLPLAICISMPLVTVIYVITNLAYFIVLSRYDILASNAVAITFGDRLLGFASFLMPLFVACATFGSLNGAIFASSRLFFVGARDGQLPRAIALINIERLTPIPSLVFMCLVTLAILLVTDIYTLINYVQFVEALFITISVAGLLYMRFTKPNAQRPIKITLAIPVIFFIICLFLIILPCFQQPQEVAVAIVFMALGIPVYYVTINWKQKPKCLQKFFNDFNNYCAILFMCIPEQIVENQT